PGPGAGDDEQRPRPVLHGPALLIGEASEDVRLRLAEAKGKLLGHAPTRAPEVTDSRWEALRSFVLLYGETLGQGDEGPNGRTLRSARRVRTILVGPVHARDVEVRPLGPVLDRRPQERRRLDGAALAAGAVADVRDLALDLVLVFVGQWHRPHPIPGGVRNAADRLDERVWLAEQADEVRTEGD